MDDILKGIGALVDVVVVIFVTMLIVPLLYAVAGYFTGWALSSVFKFAGAWVASGAQASGLEITASQLPYLGAFLGFVGSFFKSSTTKKE